MEFRNKNIEKLYNAIKKELDEYYIINKLNIKFSDKTNKDGVIIEICTENKYRFFNHHYIDMSYFNYEICTLKYLMKFFVSVSFTSNLILRFIVNDDEIEGLLIDMNVEIE